MGVVFLCQLQTQVGKLRFFFTWMFSMHWLDEYSYEEMLNTSCLTGNFPLRSWSCRVYCAFYWNRCVPVVLTPRTVTHWILHLTVERRELLLTFSLHSHEQIFTLRESTQIKKWKGYLVQSDAFHDWCLLQHWRRYTQL